MRTTINLTDAQLEALSRMSRWRNLSRAELIRHAVDRYLAYQAREIDTAFGLWKRVGSRLDGLVYQRRLRREWTR